MTDICSPEEILLQLAVPQARSAPITLSAAEWQKVDHLGAQHRLIPLLHHHLGPDTDSNIPDALRADWQAAAQRSTLSVLMAQRDLQATLDVLDGIDIQPVLLKGGYLAFACYPQPGLRPVRDLDLWIQPDQALRAYEALVGDGFGKLDSGDAALALEQRHQLPVLEAPDGTPIELHVRLAHDAGGPTPQSHSRDWQLAHRPVQTPTPALMLLHLIIHAAYDHRFDNGPLTLADLAYLLATEDIDVDEWQQLSAPWQAGCDLMLGMLASRGVVVPDGLIGAPADLDAMVMAEALMTQDMDAHGAARAASGPKLSFRETFFPNAERLKLLYGDDASWGHHFWRLVSTRMAPFLRGQMQPAARQISHMDARYRVWLEKQSR